MEGLQTHQQLPIRQPWTVCAAGSNGSLITHNAKRERNRSIPTARLRDPVFRPTPGGASRSLRLAARDRLLLTAVTGWACGARNNSPPDGGSSTSPDSAPIKPVSRFPAPSRCSTSPWRPARVASRPAFDRLRPGHTFVRWFLGNVVLYRLLGKLHLISAFHCFPASFWVVLMPDYIRSEPPYVTT